MVRRCTSFHADQAWWQFLEEGDNLTAPQLPTEHYFTVGIHTVHLKDILRDIHTNCRNGHLGRLPFHVAQTPANLRQLRGAPSTASLADGANSWRYKVSMKIEFGSAQEIAVKCTAKSALDFWRYSSAREDSSLVIPDGCRDLIFTQQVERQLRWFVSDLGHTSERVRLTADTEMLGIRLKPGMQIDERALSDWIGTNEPFSLAIGDILDEFCTLLPSTIGILDCLKSGIHSVREAAGALGVSTRTLQREVRKQTGVSPQFWMSLARVRRAGRSLDEGANAAETAYSCGYSDQAHLSRDIRRWFGVTPTCLVNDTALLSQLDQIGYA